MKNIAIVVLVFSLFTISSSQTSEPYNILNHYIPSGYMGDTENIIIKKNYTDESRPDSLCTKISYAPGDSGWGGVYWQYPANNWCTKKGKDFSNSGFTQTTFYVKGENGKEEVRFKVGQDCGDSFVSDETTQLLSKKWIKVSISLEEADLSNITGAFCWLVDSKANTGTVVFYIDDVQFE